MAQVHTVTLLADHKGNTRPKAIGDEYVVDALVDVTSHLAAGAVITAGELGLKTIHCATICGSEGANAHVPSILTSATGTYASTTTIALMFTALDGTNATVANDGDPACAVRLRVWGNL
jgi:hypothetical protein